MPAATPLLSSSGSSSFTYVENASALKILGGVTVASPTKLYSASIQITDY